MTEPGPDRDIGAAIRNRSAGVRAPDELRASIAAQRAGRTRYNRGGAAAVAAVILIAILFATDGTGPTVSQVAFAALNPPTGPAPRTDRADRRFLDLEVGGLRFPSYERPWRWAAVGSRTDEVEGRHAVTVIYRKGDRGIHYTIVAGDPLERPAGARMTRTAGMQFAVTRRRGAHVVSWELDGRTCVLTSETVGAVGLMRIATW